MPALPRSLKAIDELFSKGLENRWGRHLFFWITVFLVLTFARTSLDSLPYTPFSILLMNVHGMLPAIMAAYLLNYYLIPRFLNRRRFITFFLLFLCSAYAICAFARILTVYVNEPFFRQDAFEQESIGEILVEIGHLATVYFPVIYAVAFAMTFIKQQKAEMEIKERNVLLEKEKAETELNFLKAQIHPHFLFNTLNNLYVLTLKKSDKAPETVIKLSEILDYILYKGNEQTVPLEKEIKLIENYIALEKLRYGDQLRVSFHQSVDDYSMGISPMILLSMVENAFKHGASGQIDDPEISIKLSLQRGLLSFEVYNTKNENPQTDKTNYSKGVGVSNIKRQLALLYSDHQFNIREGKKEYQVNLSLNLSKQHPRLSTTALQENH